MGQRLIYHLGGGEEGYGYFIDHIGKSFEVVWKDLATWTQIQDEPITMLVEGVKEAMGGRSFEEIVRWRDKRIVELIKVTQSDPAK